jgi:hypothetical protein
MLPIFTAIIVVCSSPLALECDTIRVPSVPEFFCEMAIGVVRREALKNGSYIKTEECVREEGA